MCELKSENKNTCTICTKHKTSLKCKFYSFKFEMKTFKVVKFLIYFCPSSPIYIGVNFLKTIWLDHSNNN